jgi:hypothetical protein
MAKKLSLAGRKQKSKREKPDVVMLGGVNRNGLANEATKAGESS